MKKGYVKNISRDTRADDKAALKDIQRSVSRLSTPKHEDHKAAYRSMTTRGQRRWPRQRLGCVLASRFAWPCDPSMAAAATAFSYLRCLCKGWLGSSMTAWSQHLDGDQTMAASKGLDELIDQLAAFNAELARMGRVERLEARNVKARPMSCWYAQHLSRWAST